MIPRPLRPSPSPRIDELRRAGDAEAFWRDVTGAGTPLVEPDPDDPGFRLVTFVWRDVPGQEVLLLLSGVTEQDRLLNETVAPHMMDLVPGTDVRHSTYRLRADTRATYLAYPCATAPDGEEQILLTAMDTGITDPHNPTSVEQFNRSFSLFALPDAPTLRWSRPRPGVPSGELRDVTRPSALKLSSGDRPVWAYLPDGYTPGRRYPVLVMLDGDVWAESTPIKPTLDNLIAEGRIPPMIAILPSSGEQADRHRDLTCSEPFVSYLVDELLPWAATELGATTDPARTIICGQSLGGLAASHAGLTAAHRFGNVLCQSGSFWWPDEDPRRLVRRFADTEPVDVRFFVQVGRHEVSMVTDSDAFTEALAARGYDFTRDDYTGGHEYVCWIGGVADGLIRLAGDW